MTSTVGPEVLNKLKDVGTPESIDKDKVKKNLPRSTEKSPESKK
jgi:hypothetical protein